MLVVLVVGSVSGDAEERDGNARCSARAAVNVVEGEKVNIVETADTLL